MWRGFRRGSDADALARATAATRSWLGSAPLPGALLGAVMSFLEAIGVAFDGDDLGIVNEAADQGDDARGVGKHLAPFGERPIGGDQRALALIAPRDQFEHEVGMAIGIGEISDFVDHQQLRARIVAQAASQCGIAIERAKVAQQLASAGEQDRVPGISAWWAMFCARVDLPTPFGPTTTILAASLRKSSAISASMAARSQRLGQFKSKSHNGLKRPIWALRSRRSRPRLARCRSSQSSSGATQASVATSGQCATRPCRCSA